MKKFLAVTMTCALLLAGLLACSGGEAPQKRVDLSAFAKALQEKYEFAAYLGEMNPENEYDQETYDRSFPGLLELDLEQRINLVGMITLNNGEIGLAQAKTAEDAARVKEIFQKRIDYMAGDGETPGGAFYPGPTELWRNKSRVVWHGNYVMLICAEECEQIMDEFVALFS